MFRHQCRRLALTLGHPHPPRELSGLVSHLPCLLPPRLQHEALRRHLSSRSVGLHRLAVGEAERRDPSTTTSHPRQESSNPPPYHPLRVVGVVVEAAVEAVVEEVAMVTIRGAMGMAEEPTTRPIVAVDASRSVTLLSRRFQPSAVILDG